MEFSDNFSSFVSDMLHSRSNDDYDSDADEPEGEGNREDPDSVAPDEESPTEADTPDADPAPDEETEPDVDVDDDQVETDDDDATSVESDDREDGEVEAEEPDVVEPETDDTEAAELPELPEGYALEDGEIVAEIVVDGETQRVPADDLRKGYMRHADYTRKTQQLSQRAEQVQEALSEQRELARDIAQHEGMQDFLRDHPEAYEHLIANPDETRKLMGSDSELQDFVEDYEILTQSPRLAETYLNASEDDQSREQLERQRQLRQYSAFADELDAAVDRIAGHEELEEFVTEEDVQDVKDYVMDLGGFTQDSDPEAVINGLDRLATLFIADGGEQLDMKLVIDRFKQIKNEKIRQEDKEEKKAEEHNEQVDAELEEQEDRAPKTPEGDGPAPEPETLPEREDFHSVLSSLTG